MDQQYDPKRVRGFLAFSAVNLSAKNGSLSSSKTPWPFLCSSFVVFSSFVLSSIFNFGTDLSAKDGGEGSDKEDADDAHDEREDGREEEAPPFSLLHGIIKVFLNPEKSD